MKNIKVHENPKIQFKIALVRNEGKKVWVEVKTYFAVSKEPYSLHFGILIVRILLN